MSEQDLNQTIKPNANAPVELKGAAEADVVAPATLLKPPPTAGLNMVSGENVGICEGDVCFVPSLVRNEEDAG